LARRLEDHDYDEDPLLFLDCGHVYSVSTLDGHVGLERYFTRPADDQPVGATST
jgi:hypothetical protein